ncbi:MAG: hypothetical protein ACSHW1_05765 [Yoonia sp.]|uniref:hypothetical protein n=1 Tax=Yoonia sp. TaxID=2212373 RepID=UPI003EF56F1D
MSFADIIMGIFIAGGFFVAALVSRFFRRPLTGVLLGGVVGLGVSVIVLVYGLNNVFSFGNVVVEN